MVLTWNCSNYLIGGKWLSYFHHMCLLLKSYAPRLIHCHEGLWSIKLQCNKSQHDMQMRFTFLKVRQFVAKGVQLTDNSFWVVSKYCQGLYQGSPITSQCSHTGIGLLHLLHVRHAECLSSWGRLRKSQMSHCHLSGLFTVWGWHLYMATFLQGKMP